MKGFICGAFDLLHPGHLYTFKECKKRCDKLIVGLHVDPHLERGEKNAPVESIFERYVRLLSCKYVDMIVPYETNNDLINLLSTFDLDVRFLGEDYKDHPENIVGADIVPIEYIKRNHTYSSSALRKRL